MKLIYILSFVVFNLLCDYLNAQLNPFWTQQYQHTITPGFSNESRKVATDSNGNIFVLSDATSDKDPNGNVVATPQHYTVILKYTPAGVLDTFRQIYVIDHMTSGYNNPGGFGLEIDNNNNVYVGYTIYNGISNFNVAVAKHNNNLIRQWTYTFNPTSTDQGIDLKVTPSGIVYALTKSVAGGITKYGIIKCDSAAVSGTVALRTFNDNTEVLTSMAVDSNNDVFVTGYQLSNGFQSIMTARVNIFGTLKWKRIYNAGSTNRNDVGNEIDLGPNQDVYIVGTSDRGAPYGNDGVVLKYVAGGGRFEWVSFLDYNNGTESGIAIDIVNPTLVHAGVISGNKIITYRIGTTIGQLTGIYEYEPLPLNPFSVIDSVSISEFKCSVNNNVYICGNVHAKDLSSANFDADYFIKLFPVSGRTPIDSAFKLDGESQIIGTNSVSQSVTGMALHSASNSVYTVQSIVEDYSAHLNEGVQLTKYTFVLPLREGIDADNPSSDFYLYPNPVFSDLNINNSVGISEIKIFDVTGKLLIERNYVGEKNLTLKLESLPNGIYQIRIVDDAGAILNEKFVKN